MDYLSKTLNGMTIPDWTPEFNLGIPKVSLECRKQKVIYFNVKSDPDQPMFEILTDGTNGTGEPYFVIVMRGVDMDF